MVYLKIVYNAHYSHINRLRLHQPLIHLLYKKILGVSEFVIHRLSVRYALGPKKQLIIHHTILRQCPLCGTSWG
jgi:hypothetical protein